MWSILTRRSVRLISLAATAWLLAGAALAADPEFVGSKRCGDCHEEDYASWQKSFHAKMIRPKDTAILKDVVEQWNNGGPTKINLTGAPAALNDVDMVIGSRWKQRFLVRNPATGGHIFLDKQWNAITKKWEAYGNKNDWETNCATCHSTGYRLTSYDPNKPAEQKWSMVEYNVGCETCHGPGAKHSKSEKARDIYSFKGKSVEEQTRVCGYCHIRGENDLYKTAQGNPSEHLPSPVIGKTWLPGDDWTKWYAEHSVIPGVHPQDKIDAVYKGDLAGMFKTDDIAKAGNFYDAAKHHQQYQEYIQSPHYNAAKAKDRLSCSGCHTSHISDATPKLIVPKETCKECHDASYTVEKYMPGTGQTANGLFVRTHTFSKNQSRPAQTTVSGEPVYYNSKGQ